MIMFKDLLICVDLPKAKTVVVKAVLFLSYDLKGWYFGHSI